MLKVTTTPHSCATDRMLFVLIVKFAAHTCLAQIRELVAAAAKRPLVIGVPGAAMADSAGNVSKVCVRHGHDSSFHPVRLKVTPLILPCHPPTFVFEPAMNVLRQRGTLRLGRRL